MSSRHVRWDELTRVQQGWIVGLGCLEVVLTATCLADLARRRADEVRGPKALWVLALLVQPVGPVAYLAVGRRTAEDSAGGVRAPG